MDGIVHIGEAARLLGCTPEHIRTLERRGRIPPARRDHNGRIYSKFDIALLRAMGVGSRRHVFSLSKRFGEDVMSGRGRNAAPRVRLLSERLWVSSTVSALRSTAKTYTRTLGSVLLSRRLTRITKHSGLPFRTSTGGSRPMGQSTNGRPGVP